MLNPSQLILFQKIQTLTANENTNKEQTETTIRQSTMNSQQLTTNDNQTSVFTKTEETVTLLSTGIYIYICIYNLKSCLQPKDFRS
jgi:hypothetical protein